MSVLITGGCGFIGSYVARDLIGEGQEVVVTDVRDASLLNEVVGNELGEDSLPPSYQVDMSDVTGLVRVCRDHDVDTVVHAAGLLSEGSASAPAHAAAVNIVGTGAIFEIAGALDIGNIVWTSSISVFGYIASDASIADDAPHDPTSFYGLYKSTNEKQAALYYEKLGVPSTGIRVGFAYGYGRARGRGAWVYELMGKPAIGQPGRVRGGDALVPWLYVEDASAAIVLAVSAPTDGARFYNTQGKPRWKHEAVDFVREVLPEADVELVGESEGYPTGLDDSRIRQELGWKPEHTMEEGILKAINRYRESAGLSPVGSDRGE